MECTTLKLNSWVVVSSGPTSLEEGVHPDDRELLICAFPFSRALHITGKEENYIVVDSGEWSLRVLPIYLSQIPAPKFPFGCSVIRKEEDATVAAIGWHFKDQKHLYYLDIGGKRQSKYCVEEQIQSTE